MSKTRRNRVNLVADDIERFMNCGIYVPTRTIYMGSFTIDTNNEESGVDALMADRAIKSIHILSTASQAPILIIMNNPGGDWTHCMAIYDAIKTCDCYTVIMVYGYAMSAGSVILQAADRRLMSPNSKMMIHRGHLAISDHPKIVQKWTDDNKKSESWMEQLYLSKIRTKHKDFKLSKIKKMCDFDTILSADEAVALGLADGIIEPQ